MQKTLRVGAPLNSNPLPALQWVEIATSLQIPSFQIIGLPGPEVAEARERVKAAIEASGLEFPRRRVVVNLSPASVRKCGAGLDLAMALAVLVAAEDIEPIPSPFVAWGELGLDGSVKPSGQLTRALYAAWQAGVPQLLVAKDEFKAAREKLNLIQKSGELHGPAPQLFPVSTLSEAWKIVRTGFSQNAPQPPDEKEPVENNETATQALKLLPLHSSLERALGVAAAGNHHVLLLGSRGTGKSHALEWLRALQPPPLPATLLRQNILAELAFSSSSENSTLTLTGPIRKVSSQVKSSALIGGANSFFVRPGEFSLAHGGLLIADELPEWPRDSREALREPLESGKVTLSRVRGTFELPARFTLVGTGNLCPCGGWPSNFPLPQLEQKQKLPRCRCPVSARAKYLSRLSGPVLDRLDLVIFVAPPSKAQARKMLEHPSKSTLGALKENVRLAREKMIEKWGSTAGFLSSTQLEDLISSHSEWGEWLQKIPFTSMRSRHKVLRLALSLAAWDGIVVPGEIHFTEASFYRPERLGLCE